ncbi:MAG: hypothetical protein PUJ21_05610 [Clostridia bacterium]|nr:hypothetical protein [Clostridia bacterium]MDY6184655.1 hypothetical protein [Eubacteriales bacterium]
MKKLFSFVLVISLLTVFALGCFSCGKEPVKEQDPQYEKALSLAKIAIDKLKSKLKSPSTMVVASISVEYSDSMDLSDIHIIYSAQNSYGGTVDDSAYFAIRLSTSGIKSSYFGNAMDLVSYYAAIEGLPDASDRYHTFIHSDDYGYLGVRKSENLRYY